MIDFIFYILQSPDSQKENLKNSLGRWNDRTSPYMFNANGQIITPINNAKSKSNSPAKGKILLPQNK